MVIIGTVFIEDLDNKEKLAEVANKSDSISDMSCHVASIPSFQSYNSAWPENLNVLPKSR